VDDDGLRGCSACVREADVLSWQFVVRLQRAAAISADVKSHYVAPTEDVELEPRAWLTPTWRLRITVMTMTTVRPPSFQLRRTYY